MIDAGRRILGTLLLCGVLSAALYAEHVPAARSGEVDYQLRLYASKDMGDFEPTAELLGRVEEGEYRYTSATLGGYYRVLENLKLGAFYRLQFGARHDDDWLDTNPGWAWDDTRARPEQILILDASPRFLLDFLPGENWVLLIKNRYLFNTYNGDQTLLVRPGITYFHIRDREPVYNVGLQYGLYLPLNFSDVPIYEHDPYLNFVHHLNQRLKLELFAALRSRTWTTSHDVDTSVESEYEVTDRVVVVGAGVILRF